MQLDFLVLAVRASTGGPSNSAASSAGLTLNRQFGTVPAMRLGRKVLVWWAAMPLACFLVLVGGYTGYELLTGNVHKVTSDLFRSGQLSTSQLERVLRQNAIRSVLNLRGASQGQWYVAETNLCVNLGIKHVSLKLSASRELRESEMEALAELMRDLPKPLLIHCTGGADRTSLACALYSYDVDGEPARIAAHQLGMFYGHVPYLNWSYAKAMDRSFAAHVAEHPPGHVASEHRSMGEGR